MAVRQLPAPDRRSGKAHGAWPHVGLKSLPSTPVVTGIAFASAGNRPVMVSFLGSIVHVKPSAVSHRLVPPTRFNNAFSTKAIRLFRVHKRINLRVSKGIRPVLLPFLGSIVPVKPPVVSHRLVPPTRFNSAFSTKAIRLFGVHERTNLRVTKGIPLVNKAFLDSAVPERPSCIVPTAARHRFGTPVNQQTSRFCNVAEVTQ